MQAHAVHSAARVLAYIPAASSAAAMLYAGLYQSRAVQHLWCPVFGKGCEAVAGAPFARPFRVPMDTSPLFSTASSLFCFSDPLKSSGFGFRFLYLWVKRQSLTLSESAT